MAINPIKTLKNSILTFQRYFYDPRAMYADALIDKWVKGLVDVILNIFIKGFVFWLVLLSLTSIFNISGITLAKGFWILLNIFQLGIILWFFENLYEYLRRGYKNEKRRI